MCGGGGAGKGLGRKLKGGIDVLYMEITSFVVGADLPDCGGFYYSPLGIPNRHQECKDMQRHDQDFLHMGLLSHDN